MAKTKVSIMLDKELLARAQAAAAGASRSAVIERALRDWLSHAAQARLDDEVERYYRELDDAGRTEDKAWARLGASCW